ncbi:MAG: hypothetical protein NC350_04045 [Corallococcus sp.]|nr:hypothetical protein [Corallococcus sp.]
MKKSLVIVCALLLVLSLGLAACANDQVVITVSDNITVTTGEKIDWARYVTVKVNGSEVKLDKNNYEVRLISGDETKGGLCSYEFVYKHGGAEYTKDVFVNYVKGVSITLKTQNVQTEVGYKPDWAKYITVTASGSPVSIDKCTIALKSGRLDTVGECVYTVSYSDGTNSDSLDVTVTVIEKIVTFEVPEVVVLPLGYVTELSEYITVKVYNEEIEVSSMDVALKSGDDKTTGNCIYTVTYRYNGRPYSTDVNVEFIESAVEMTIVEDIKVTVGSTIDWKDYVTLIVDGEPSTDTVTAELIDGDGKNHTGVCTYLLKYEYKGYVYKQTADVTYERPAETALDSAEASALDVMLQKAYTSYVFGYEYMVLPDNGMYVRERDTVQNNKVFVERSEIVREGQTVPDTQEYYIQEFEDNVTFYGHPSGNNDVWFQTNWTKDEYVFLYGDYMPYAQLLCDVVLDNNSPLRSSMFAKRTNGDYAVSERYLNAVADAIFGVGDNQTYIELILKTDGNNITEVTGRYFYVALDDKNNVVEMEEKVTMTWSNFEQAVVELPETTELPVPGEEIPEHVAPTENTLDQAQLTVLTNALGKTYDKVSYSYTNDKGTSNTLVDGKGTKSGDRYYYYNYERVLYYDSANDKYVDMFPQTTEYAFVKVSDAQVDYYEYYGQNGDWQYGRLNYTAAQLFTEYLAIADFNLSADMFGAADGMYVVNKERLADLEALLKEYFEVGSSDIVTFKLITFTLTVDGNGNVTSWNMLASAATNRNKFYWKLTFNYSEFETATVATPVDRNLASLDSAQQTSLTAALEADFSNVTFYETAGGATVRYAGKDVVVSGKDNNANDFTDYYLIEGGKYYEVNGSVKTEINYGGAGGFTYYVLKFDFAALNSAEFKYDGARSEYYVQITAEQFAQFAYYWTDYFQDDVNALAFILGEDGKIETIRAISESKTVSVKISDYGTTSATDNGEEK